MVDSTRTGLDDAIRVSFSYLGRRLGAHLAHFGPEQWAHVHVVARRLRSGVVRAIHHLGDAPRSITSGIPMAAGFDGNAPAGHSRGFLGPHGPHHGLYAHCHYFGGFHALEPHYTKTLARLLSPVHAGSAAIERTRTFVAALHDAAGAPAPDSLSGNDVGAGLTVEPEVAVHHQQSRKRIDVLVRWTDDAGQPHALVIEAKFRASVRDGTLAAYRKFAVRTAGGSERVHLFLVANRIDPTATARNRQWRQVTWLSVLRHWERRLVASPGTHDEEFVHFRSALWQRAADRR